MVSAVKKVLSEAINNQAKDAYKTPDSVKRHVGAHNVYYVKFSLECTNSGGTTHFKAMLQGSDFLPTSQTGLYFSYKYHIKASAPAPFRVRFVCYGHKNPARLPG